MRGCYGVKASIVVPPAATPRAGPRLNKGDGESERCVPGIGPRMPKGDRNSFGRPRGRAPHG
ncbi:hypothetical protein SSP531S_14560 [Streptomyces spongiicola]|uniref:Uncharacterized protein n=1 Tax=Streptomyces spongiicola TaxID=1690221 RepID=A0A388STW0_9ACTN|nr:hypothetical protein SSP531S_14560 [Streptomyces spongiicola]